MPRDAAPTDPEELLAQAGWLRSLARGLVRDSHLADDIAQDTIAAAATSPPRDGVPLRAWLARVARNLSLNALRARSRRQRHEQTVAVRANECAAPCGDPAETAERAEAMRVAFDGVLALDPPLRDVVLARYFEQLDWDATARRLGVPVETARTRMKRAMAVLRERLDRRFGSRSAWGGLLGTWASGPGGPSSGGGVAGSGAAPHALPHAPRLPVIGAAVGTATGGILMGVATKLSVAALAIAVVSLGWWGMRDDPETGRDANVGTSGSAASRGGGFQRPGRAAHAPDRPEDDATPMRDDLPPPVDPDRCDRDRDVFGRVTSEDGAPIAGARVAAFVNPWSRLGIWRPAAEFEAGPATRTAADGTFVLRLARGASIDLRVGAAGFGDVTRENCLAGERVMVTLARGSPLTVHAADETGRPVDGAKVRVRRLFGGAQQFQPVRQEIERTTGTDGVASFDGLVAGIVSVTFSHPTLGEPGWQEVRVPETGELRVVLPAGRTVRGRVGDSSGRAIAGARIGAATAGDRDATTDTEGRFEFRAWTGIGTTVLHASSRGHIGTWQRVPETGEVNFTLARGSGASGRVVGPDGDPVAGAYVVARGVSSDQRSHVSCTARTSAEGRFALDGLAPGLVHALSVAADGLGRVVVDFDAPMAEAAPAELGDVQITVARSIEGVVTDGDGTPLPEVAVSLVGANDDRGLRRAATGAGTAMAASESRRTDDLGRFRFPDVAPGTYVVIPYVFAAPRVEGTRIVVPADRDVLDARVSLPGARRLVVRVVDEEGAPVEEVSVRVSGRFGSDGSGATHPLSLWTDADGLATARGLPAAETSVFVSPSSAANFLYESLPPFVPDGSEVRVVLRRASTVEGVVVGEDGRPVPNLGVEAECGGDRPGSWSAMADGEGRFTVRVPRGAEVALVVTGRRLVATKELSSVESSTWRGRVDGVRAPARDVVVRVSQAAAAGDRTITILVLDSTGAPMPEARVGAHGRTPGSFATGVTDAAGSATLTGLVAEELRAQAERVRSSQSVLRRLELPPAFENVVPSGQTLTLRFRAAVPIRGRVVDADGRAEARVLVNVTTDDGAHESVLTDADGRFTAPGLPGHTHRLTCARRTGNETALEASADGIVPDASQGAADVVLRLGDRAD